MANIRSDNWTKYVTRAFERFGPELHETMPSVFNAQYEQIFDKLTQRFTKVVLKRIGNKYVLQIYRGNKIYQSIKSNSFDRLMFEAAKYWGV